MEKVRQAVQAALDEDIGSGDATTLAIIPEHCQAKARLRARESLVIAGLDLAEAAFRALSSEVKLRRLAQEGVRVRADETVLRLEGPARPLLTAERVALNFVQRLSGIATVTADFVAAIKPCQARILDTRKTIPGWRWLEKYAVACGGGWNHRAGLFDRILIKDNHLAALKDQEPDAVTVAVRRARQRYPGLTVEVEADTLRQVEQAVSAGVDCVLLDNMSVGQLTVAVDLCKGRVQTEASGGVTLATVRSIAETGVDFISVGALTHSARAVDLGLDFELG
jgi:nicotinate-nucleotide pyrophosphorylase (carboxylating)